MTAEPPTAPKSEATDQPAGKPVQPAAATLHPSLAASAGEAPSIPLPYLPGMIVPPGAAMLIAQQTQSWQGPYPPPEAAERFEALLPGTFNRIMTMAESAQAAQIIAVAKAQDYTRRDMRRGHILGFVSSAMAMGGSLVCLNWGYQVVAGLFLSVPVMAVAKALIEGTRSQVAVQPVIPERAERTKNAPPDKNGN